MILYINMNDFEITKQGIVIIQWLRDGDPQLGEILYNTIKPKESERENYFVEYYNVDSKKDFRSVMQYLIDNTKEGTLFTLHIVSHGNMDGIGTALDDMVVWSELFCYSRRLNVIMGNNLLLVLSSCIGGGILSYIEPEDRAPYRAIIANTRSVIMADALKGFESFYADYYNMLDFPKAIKALNEAIDFSEELAPGRQKTEFFIMTAEHSFDEVFNPDRDPVYFRTLVDRLLPPNPLIPLELRVEKAKELLRKRGEQLKPHFCFQD